MPYKSGRREYQATYLCPENDTDGYSLSCHASVYVDIYDATIQLLNCLNNSLD